ncbi:beta-N-acetylhexosaminidase [Mesobacillus persicus]|uniref:beta-N-acetylhexosaminidase n=1 Tax=Mesobacillus persicus TaxID=930146 RepID=A0A1H8JXK1_9BACI|nr:glycoside hydrolase family 3 N-terminal domain-containing protein [Mesobacillus persicus]SEN85420.1 beta-N-acetylhexosaminidase [Mesobacillus persicus]
MNRIFISLIPLWILIVILLAGCSEFQRQPSTEKEQDETEVATSSETNLIEKQSVAKEESLETVILSKEQNSIETRVNELIAKMTLEEKIGQLVVVGFPSKQVDSHIQTMIEKYKVGGVILYDRNMESPHQVAQLTRNLQKLSINNKLKIPLMISVDQEGGQIVRMKHKLAPKPSQQELGEKVAVYKTNLRTGNELKEMGITVNYAPVLDLSATDNRSFGMDPKKAERFGSEAIKGLNDAGITATLKHFPGHGRSEIDPHFESSSVDADQLDLENKDIYPFKKNIEEIDHQQFFVMVTHIKYPAYDKKNPASISPVIIKELLREKLGYKGLVVTDDLEMGAVNKYFTYKDLGYSAVAAGNDVLLVCHTFESQKQVIDGIREAVETNKLTEERIDESVRRILTYKLGS